MPQYSAETVRAMILQSQCLSDPTNEANKPDQNSILGIIDRVRALQIDTLQMIRRSQYIALWSRLGDYQPELLDDLCYGDDRRLFEYWYHAACIIPIKEFPYRLPTMLMHRKKESRRWRSWHSDEKNVEVLQEVKDRLSNQGPQKASNFDDHGEHRGSWWNWKPAKRALEYLYDSGQVVIANRLKFQRVYGITENYIPKKLTKSTITMDHAISHDLELSLLATGLCTPQQVADYTHMKRGLARPYVKSLMERGLAHKVRAVNVKGETIDLLIHRDNIETLEKLAAGEFKPSRTTFLTPFDSLFWAKGRGKEFFDFAQVLECYKPAENRVWGYFCLPVLHNGNLVGRFDPKLDRKSGTLQIHSFHLESGIKPSERLVSDIAIAMRNFLKFHGASKISFGLLGNNELMKKLERTI